MRAIVALSVVTCALGIGADRKFPEDILNVLKTNCYSCHGDKGEKAGRFESILDLEDLIRNKKIIPGNPKESTLVVRLTAKGSRRMPPPEDYDGKALASLSAAQITSLESFIKALSATAETTSPAVKDSNLVEYEDLQSIVKKDLEKQKEESRKWYRYFTFTHLGPEDATKARRAAGAWLNFLSWGKTVILPTPVAGTNDQVTRFDLRDFGWSAAHWDLLIRVYPYVLRPRHGLDDSLRDNEKDLVDLTGSSVPFVKGDWFLSVTGRPPLYHELLALPKTRTELKNILEAGDAEKQLRAGFKHSLVAFHNRDIAMSEGRFGTYWETFDFDLRDSVEKTNLFERPLDSALLVAGKNAHEIFEQAGGELIFTLPNGLHGYYVIDKTGQRIDQAPYHVANHPRVPTEISTGQMCLTCHTSGLVPFKDELFDFAKYRFARDLVSRDTLDRVKKLHGDQAELIKKRNDTNSAFAESEAKLTLGKEGLAEVLAGARLYDRRIKLPQLEQELGRSRKELLSEERLEGFKRARRESGQAKFEDLFYRAEKDGISRDEFEREFKGLSELAHLGTPPVFSPLIVRTFFSSNAVNTFASNYLLCISKKARMLRPADLFVADTVPFTFSNSSWSSRGDAKETYFLNDPKQDDEGVLKTSTVTLTFASGRASLYPAPTLSQQDVTSYDDSKPIRLKSETKVGLFDIFRAISSLTSPLQKDILESTKIKIEPAAAGASSPLYATAACITVDFTSPILSASSFRSGIKLPDWVRASKD